MDQANNGFQMSRSYTSYITLDTSVFINLATSTLHLGHVTRSKIAFGSCDTALRKTIDFLAGEQYFELIIDLPKSILLARAKMSA